MYTHIYTHIHIYVYIYIHSSITISIIMIMLITTTVRERPRSAGEPSSTPGQVASTASAGAYYTYDYVATRYKCTILYYIVLHYTII